MEILTEQSWIQQTIAGLQTWLESLDLAALDFMLFAGLVLSWTALFLSLVAVKKVKKQAASSYRLYEKIVHDLHIAGSGAIGMGQRIIAVERKLAKQPHDIGNQEDFAVQELFELPKTIQESPRPNLKAVPNPLPEAKRETEFKNELGTAQLLASKQKKAATATSATATAAVIQSIEDPFDLAKGLLRRGIAQAEVAKRCGLSLSETALMAMVLNNKPGRMAS